MRLSLSLRLDLRLDLRLATLPKSLVRNSSSSSSSTLHRIVLVQPTKQIPLCAIPRPLLALLSLLPLHHLADNLVLDDFRLCGGCGAGSVGLLRGLEFLQLVLEP